MKKCPKCGASVDSNSKFCTNCGYSFMNDDQNKVNNQQTNTQENINRNVESVKKYSNGYFSWFMKSIKKPSESIENTHTYYGLTSFIISAVLISLIVMRSISAMMSSVGTYTSALTEGQVNFDDSKIATGSFVLSLIVVCLLMVLWIGLGFLAKKISTNKGIKFSNFLNNLAFHTNYVLIVDIFILFVSLFSDGGSSSSFSLVLIVFALLILIPIIYNIGLSLIIFKDQSTKLDKIYAYIGAIVIDLIIIYEFLKMF